MSLCVYTLYPVCQRWFQCIHLLVGLGHYVSGCQLANVCMGHLCLSVITKFVHPMSLKWRVIYAPNVRNGQEWLTDELITYWVWSLAEIATPWRIWVNCSFEFITPLSCTICQLGQNRSMEGCLTLNVWDTWITDLGHKITKHGPKCIFLGNN